MSSAGIDVLLVLFAVWAAACTAKAIRALQTGSPYRFSLWDGGLLRDGKVLTRRGTQTKAVVVALLCVGCVAWLAHLVPFRTGQIALMALAAASIVSDLIQTER